MAVVPIVNHANYGGDKSAEGSLEERFIAVMHTVLEETRTAKRDAEVEAPELVSILIVARRLDVTLAEAHNLAESLAHQARVRYEPQDIPFSDKLQLENLMFVGPV